VVARRLLSDLLEGSGLRQTKKLRILGCQKLRFSVSYYDTAVRLRDGGPVTEIPPAVSNRGKFKAIGDCGSRACFSGSTTSLNLPLFSLRSIRSRYPLHTKADRQSFLSLIHGTRASCHLNILQFAVWARWQQRIRFLRFQSFTGPIYFSKYRYQRRNICFQINRREGTSDHYGSFPVCWSMAPILLFLYTGPNYVKPIGGRCSVERSALIKL
jgi:hypothetical protein